MFTISSTRITTDNPSADQWESRLNEIEGLLMNGRYDPMLYKERAELYIELGVDYFTEEIILQAIVDYYNKDRNDPDAVLMLAHYNIETFNEFDLGRVVDLMDQGKLLWIQTHSQIFSNNPNEKFLLMILCSQAKLENDNRGINVKRGLRNKCSIGIRLGVAPIGYINSMKGNRIASVEVDQQRAPIIKEMFNKVANEGYSGRLVKKWLDDINFTTKNGCKIALGRMYETLKNPFYYGEFVYGDKRYKGIHEPLITKKTFEKVRINLAVAPREWNKQLFPFKKICGCGSCGASVTAEIKYRRQKNGKVNTHIYYHCNRKKDYHCKEPYITEDELIKQLISNLPEIKLNTSYLWNEFKTEVKRLNHLKGIINKIDEGITATPHINSKTDSISINEAEKQMLFDYILHILQFGTPEERIQILAGIESRFELINSKLSIRK